ncbi:hypothetical protein HY418_02190, partial [Candidatus Kaiserbacteria bacterium]|nr:hypothetical protein [Candidatus Kaiserbacteria bacterium]
HLERSIDAGAVLKALKEEKVVPKDATWKDVSFSRSKDGAESPAALAGRKGI